MKVESENGAVDVGNKDLILPVRVRACAEDVDRTVRVTLRGCSQCVPVMGVTERPVNGTSQGSVSAEVGVRASTLWAKHRNRAPRLDRGVRECGYRLRLLWCLARSCEDNGVHSNQMKSHAVSARLSRATVIYKALPKRSGMRRIREAVSGSADLWDGSRAVVATRQFGW